LHVTIFSFFMAILWCSLFVLLAALIEHDFTFVRKYGIMPVLAVMTLAIARFAIPIEPSHSIVVGSDMVIPAIQHFLVSKCCTYRGHTICWAYVFIAVWTLGTVLMLGNFLLQTFQTNRRLHNLQSFDDPNAAAVLEKIVTASKPEQRYHLIITDEIQTPMLIGFFVPTILLPQLDLSKDELSYVFLHEWSHFMHKDLWKKLLLDFICAFLWWNPIVYVIKKNFDYVLEVNCDRYVVQSGKAEDHIRYVETIVKVMKQMLDRQTASLQPSIPFVAISDQNMITQRCELILDSPKKTNKHILWPYICMFALILVSYIFVIQPRTSAPPDSGISINTDGSYLVPQGDKYGLYVDGKSQGTVTSGEINKPPFSNLNIKGSEKR